MISQPEFGQNSMTENKQSIPENIKYDGPSVMSFSGASNKFAADSNLPLSKPGSSG